MIPTRSSEMAGFALRLAVWYKRVRENFRHGVSSSRMELPFAKKGNLGCVFIRSLALHAKSLHLCPALCDPMDCNPPGSSVHEILQARILEWVAMPSSRGSSWPRDQTLFSYAFCIGRHILRHNKLCLLVI